MSEGAPAERDIDQLPPRRVADLSTSGDAQLFDVRSRHEWEAGRLPGAAWVHLPELGERAAEVDRTRAVVFYCRSGDRSAMAAAAFRSEGFDAHSMQGGIVAWAQEGLPLDPEQGYVAESGEAAAELQARRMAAGD
ncbi:MAG: rhodanese-like domain-containing protein [Solirubrobacterales bacterium]